MGKCFLLDRNILSIIKDSINNKPQKTTEKINMLGFLKKIDRRTNFVSPILSIIEGQTGKRESKNEITQTILKESDFISSFFKFARVDTSFLQEHHNYMSSVFSENTEENWDNYDCFLTEVNKLLYQRPKKILIPKVKNEILVLSRFC